LLLENILCAFRLKIIDIGYFRDSDDIGTY